MAVQLSVAIAVPLCVSFLVTAFLVASQRWHGKLTLDHDLAGVQKNHTTAVPRVGGIALFTSILLALVLSFYVDGLVLTATNATSAGLLLVASVPAFAAGILEDLTKKVSVRVRLFASIASAILASWLLGATVDQLNIWGVDSLLVWAPFALLVTAIVVAGGVNAVNIIDGFNGLAGSTAVIMLGALGMVGFHAGDILVAQLAMLVSCATVGFLLVNYPAGRIFLGDGGAYFLGFWIAEIAVLLLVRNESVNAWQVLSICAYPIIEVLFSIYRRRVLRKSNPGAPDGLHLHTLVFRRLVPRFLTNNHERPYRRNASVTLVMTPLVALPIILAVIAGGTIINAILIVAAQLLLYLSCYARLVRGRWLPRQVVPQLTHDEVNVNAS